ncbi:putative ankyrin repeat protein [Diaporthe ampelina]|uniref:Putative ankyrin repeat protein n=1 Tax=Diaporthe ampelina TaxID=1214573 RepID=A0A0G2FN51_9PEZI|nr:putative ankyrin repeat protein [Diaporthe ampelina]
MDDEAPPPYDENTSEHFSDVKGLEPPALPAASPSSPTKARQSKLSEVFRAVTAAFRYKPEPLVVALCEASSRGDLSTVVSLVSSGANINGRNDDGKTPLVQAIENQHSTVVTKLLQLGASKDVSDSAKKLPALFWAASAGDISMAKLLLQHGCNPNHKNLYGSAYFLDIVDKGDLGMVELLLGHGAEVNTTDRYGRAAIQHAYSANNLAMLKLLQSRGGSVNATDMTGNPIIILALRENRDEIFDFLLERGANVNSSSSTGTSLIIEAFTKKRISVVKKLLERGADPNAKDLMGTSLLMNAIKAQPFAAKDREELIKLLLTYGATSNDSDMWGKPALR